MSFHPCAVPVPEMGPDAHIRFTVDGMERLEAVYPDHWVRDVARDLAAVSTSAMRNILAVTLFGAEVEETVASVPYRVLALRIEEAMYTVLVGREKYHAVKGASHA